MARTLVETWDRVHQMMEPNLQSHGIHLGSVRRTQCHCNKNDMIILTVSLHSTVTALVLQVNRKVTKLLTVIHRITISTSRDIIINT